MNAKEIAESLLETWGSSERQSIGKKLAQAHLDLLAKQELLLELLKLKDRLLSCYRLGTRRGIDKILDGIVEKEAMVAKAKTGT